MDKTAEYFNSNPELVPSFINKDEFIIDKEARNTLFEFNTPLSQIVSMLEDSIILSGSEAYIAALSFYSSVKNASKMNIPGAKKVFEELKKRFNT